MNYLLFQADLAGAAADIFPTSARKGGDGRRAEQFSQVQLNAKVSRMRATG